LKKVESANVLEKTILCLA